MATTVYVALRELDRVQEVFRRVECDAELKVVVVLSNAQLDRIGCGPRNPFGSGTASTVGDADASPQNALTQARLLRAHGPLRLRLSSLSSRKLLLARVVGGLAAALEERNCCASKSSDVCIAATDRELLLANAGQSKIVETSLVPQRVF